MTFSKLTLVCLLFNFPLQSPGHFFEQPITNRSVATSYFQFSEDTDRALVPVTFCEVFQTLVVYDNCFPYLYPVHEIIQRATAQKMLWLQLDVEACIKIPESLLNLLNGIRWPNIYLGMRIVPGPLSNIPLITVPPCFVGHRNPVIMFDEYPAVMPTSDKYTIMETWSIAQTAKSLNASWVAIDSFYSFQGPVNVTNFLQGLGIMFYTLPGNPMAGPLDEYYFAFSQQASLARQAMTFFDRQSWEAMNSFDHLVYWDHVASELNDKHKQLTNMLVLQDYLSGVGSLIYLTVFTVNNQHQLNLKGASSSAVVPLTSLLQLIDTTRTVVLHFPEEDYYLTNFDKYIPQHRVYILVEALIGPNFNSNTMQLQSLDKIVAKFKRVMYVVGFAEQFGKESAYRTKHAVILEKALQYRRHAGLELGLNLRADFLKLCSNGFVWRIREVVNISVLFVYSDMNQNVRRVDVKAIKNTVKFLGKGCFYKLGQVMRENLYRREAPEEISSPSATTTSGHSNLGGNNTTSSTSSTVNITISQVPLETYTALSTTTLKRQYSDILFPKVVGKGISCTSIRQRGLINGCVLGVLIMKCCI